MARFTVSQSQHQQVKAIEKNINELQFAHAQQEIDYVTG